MIEIIVPILIAAFLMEFIDSTVGGGFGTVLSPLLLIFGYEPIAVVSSILLSEIMTGFLVGILHDRASSLEIMKSREAKITLAIFMLSGVLASLFAMIVVVSVDALFVKTYIAVLVMAMGILMLYNRNETRVFSFKVITFLGLLCGFNKTLSGGGYGPIATSGQIINGASPKLSIAITSISEAVICVVSFIGYYLLFGIENMSLLVSILIGAILATPISAFAVSKTKERNLTQIIAVSVLIIGAILLIKLFI
ncbi:sulfite exporter TauE/SafE family protein [Candidatus Thorarchaeota archaeon]|nr:MAG: sulfite exporter TauE/SafE family protein [Candidatus Thorarchaeota archaeon]